MTIFHPQDGPKILFQMPEDLFYAPDLPKSETRLSLDFSTLSEYVIPKPALCNRLLGGIVRSHEDAPGKRRPFRVLCFPVLLEAAEKYERNHFIFTLTFVFDGHADTQPYEPIVRKCARLLRMLEEESSFVSRLDNLPRLYSIVEQLYEDLNVYHETFVALPELAPATRLSLLADSSNLTLVDPEELDALVAQAPGPLARVRANRGLAPVQLQTRSAKPQSHLRELDDEEHRSHAHEHETPKAAKQSLESSTLTSAAILDCLGRTVRDSINLKLFARFPNPIAVQDWDVPVLLIDMERYATDGWDLTLLKVLPFIDGVHHVKRIAQLADINVALVKRCIEHLLYYSFAVLIDIFQFSNMYTARPQIARMLDDAELGAECAAYVARHRMTPLPSLLLWRMYSMLSMGRTVGDWIDMVGEPVLSVDVRRFVTFGVIKGFLRRLRRYPMYLGRREEDGSLPSPALSMTHDVGTVFSPSSSHPATMQSLDESIHHLSSFSRLSEARTLNHKQGRTLHRPLATAIDIGSLAHGTAPKHLFGEYGSTRAPPLTSTSRNSRREPSSSDILSELPVMLDGSRCDDELCVHFGMSWTDLQSVMACLPSCDSPFYARNEPSPGAPFLQSRQKQPSGYFSYVSSFASRTRSPAEHSSSHRAPVVVLTL